MKNTQRKNDQDLRGNRTERKSFDVPSVVPSQKNERSQLNREDAGGTNLGHKKSQEAGSDREIRKQ